MCVCVREREGIDCQEGIPFEKKKIIASSTGVKNVVQGQNV